MADNYLERKMEEYRRNGGGQDVKRVAAIVASSKVTANDLVMRFPAMRVVIVGNGNPELTDALAKRFRGVDARVALVGEKSRGLMQMGQKRGCRVYQLSGEADRNEAGVMEDLEKAWGGVDVAILTDNEDCRGGEGVMRLRVSAESGDDLDDVALAALLATHKASAMAGRIEKLW